VSLQARRHRLQSTCGQCTLMEVFTMPMHNPLHPGLTVRHDCLEPLGAKPLPPSLSANGVAR